MPGTTTNFSWPTPSNGDPAQVAIDTTASLAAIDSTLGNAWTSYTPTWTSSGTAVSIGNGTITGRYKLFGKWGIVQMRLNTGGTSSFGTGDYTLSLPSGWSMSSTMATSVTRGWGYVVDSSTTTYYMGIAYYVTATTVGFRTHGATANVGATVPMTWASADNMQFECVVELT